ncbi:site-specific integrase [uncultured Alistipes sp.]|jgi:site-specific recombinase xerD|uniref:tyrosine-type recombinase/integrase n=1 Tax=uncultured Alistipes sp. TaxID=538949 RepID=UPI0025DA550D|nr:site-specific integrase [uncultured Alistipes sp.]
MRRDKYFKIEPRQDRAKEGKCPFRMKLTKANQRKFIPLNLTAGVDDWDTANEMFVIRKAVKSAQKSARNRCNEAHNAYLEGVRTRARNTIADFEREGIDFTLNQFVDRFLSRGQRSRVMDYWKAHIEILKATGHIGNATCYENTLHILRLFDEKFGEKVFQEIDILYVKRFDVWLQMRKCKGNTRKYYHKALRAMLNKAIQDGKASAGTYPYGRGGFEVAGLEEETAKRYLPMETMAKIKTTQLDNRMLETTRRIFVSMYLCYGISWIDATALTADNIHQLNSGKHIIYKRSKTMHSRRVKPIIIKITPELQNHLDWFAQHTNLVEGRLFPIVTQEGCKGEQLYKHIRSRFVKNNKHLKELAQALGLGNISLTSYVSRHTMAMTLQSNDIPREIISQILGHRDIKITATYLDSFENEKIAAAARVL